jgi:L-lactate dehydrogenase complex protein LldG
MSARDAILARVRAAARTGRVPYERRTKALAEGPAAPIDDLLARFSRELAALGVDCHVEATPEAVRARMVELSSGAAVFSWDADRLPYGTGTLVSGAATGRDARERQAAAGLGVTGCHAAIAETGSLVVLSGPGIPRAASLLPPVHLCLVRRADMFATMGEFFRERAGDIAASSCCTFITGPSRTADIELTLTLGVHGPGRVMVVVGP